MSTLTTSGPSTRTTTRPSPSQRLVLSINRHERWCVAVVIAIFGLLAVYSAVTAPLWFDEFFTLNISRLSSFAEMLKAMPADGQPPLQYLLTHLSLRLFNSTELSLRLPEVLAYLASGLITWRIVRFRGTGVQALFALTMFLGATSGSYLIGGFSSMNLAFTARPYELILAFTAMAFFCWQVAAERERNRLVPLAGLTCAIAGVVVTHHFGIVQVGAFLGAGEIARYLKRRRLDLPLMAASAAGLLPLIFTVPLARQTQMVLGLAIRHSSTFWDKPSIINLYGWPMMVPWLLFLPLTLLACLRESSQAAPVAENEVPAAPSHEVAAATALAFLFPAQLLLALVRTGYFFPRYGIGTSLGLVLLCAWAWPRSGLLRTLAQPALALLTLGYVCIAAEILILDQATHPIQRAQPAQQAVSPLLLHAPGQLPIVEASACDYLAQWWYAPRDLKERLLYLSDLGYALNQPSFVAELSLMIDKAYMPFPVGQYSDFLSSHPRFLLLATGRPHDNWISARLQRSGWHLHLLSTSGSDQMYLVTRP